LAALALAVLLVAASVVVKIASGSSAALIVVWPGGGSQRSRVLLDRFGVAHEVAKDPARSDGGPTLTTSLQSGVASTAMSGRWPAGSRPGDRNADSARVCNLQPLASGAPSAVTSGRSRRVTSLAFVQSPGGLGVVKVPDGRTWRFGELAVIVSPWTSRFGGRAVLLW
jgi:hypothetical protein